MKLPSNHTRGANAVRCALFGNAGRINNENSKLGGCELTLPLRYSDICMYVREERERKLFARLHCAALMKRRRLRLKIDSVWVHRTSIYARCREAI